MPRFGKAGAPAGIPALPSAVPPRAGWRGFWRKDAGRSIAWSLLLTPSFARRERSRVPKPSARSGLVGEKIELSLVREALGSASRSSNVVLAERPRLLSGALNRR